MVTYTLNRTSQVDASMLAERAARADVVARGTGASNTMFGVKEEAP